MAYLVHPSSPGVDVALFPLGGVVTAGQLPATWQTGCLAWWLHRVVLKDKTGRTMVVRAQEPCVWQLSDKCLLIIISALREDWGAGEGHLPAICTWKLPPAALWAVVSPPV